MRLVFFGPPGAGKGTVAALLEERLRVAHISSGNLLRAAVRRGDAAGQVAGRFMKAGALVSDALVTSLVLNRVDDLDGNRSFVLDGFPRTVEQARALDKALAEKRKPPIDLAIDFDISPQIAVTRLAGRRVCERCGANYHIVTLPPRRLGFCDRCGIALTTRPDDQAQTIVKRFTVHGEQTAPLLDFYRVQGKLRSVSGEAGIEEEYQSLLKVLKTERLV